MKVEPAGGFEPPSCWLRSRRSGLLSYTGIGGAGCAPAPKLRAVGSVGVALRHTDCPHRAENRIVKELVTGAQKSPGQCLPTRALEPAGRQFVQAFQRICLKGLRHGITQTKRSGTDLQSKRVRSPGQYMPSVMDRCTTATGAHLCVEFFNCVQHRARDFTPRSFRVKCDDNQTLIEFQTLPANVSSTCVHGARESLVCRSNSGASSVSVKQNLRGSVL